MTFLLLFPPVSDVVHPPLGLALLSGFLRRNGIEVKCLDLNIRSFHHFLNRVSLLREIQRVEDRVRLLEAKDALNDRERQEYFELIKIVLCGGYLSDHIDSAMMAMRDPSVFSDWELYGQSVSIIRRSMQLVASSHFPAIWEPQGFQIRWVGTNGAEILEATKDENANFLIPFMVEELNKLINSNPRMIGISINYQCQLIPGMTLARLAKTMFPGVPIILGGAFFASYANRWELFLPFSECVDAIVPFAGENPLLMLLQSKLTSGLPDEIPGVVYLRSGGVSFVASARPVQNSLPDFSDFPLDQYLSPVPMVPYRTSEACYWGKCTFCSQHQQHPWGYRKVSHRRMVEDLTTVIKETGASVIYFTDEALAPATASALCEASSARKLEMSWFADMRMEDRLDDEFIKNLRKSGCLLLIFGLESGSDRILAAMQKGIQRDLNSRILMACTKSDIKTFLMFFFGFPGETPNDATATISFVEENQEHIHYMSFDRFMLLLGTPVHEAHSSYGIQISAAEGKGEIRHFVNFHETSGPSKREMADFVDLVRKREIFKKILEPEILSRNHLPFLSKRDRILPFNHLRSQSKEFDIIPQRIEGISHRKLPFSVATPGASPRRLLRESSSYYCSCNPKTERMLETEYDLSLLLRLCNGTKTAQTISKELGRPEIIGLLKELHEMGFV